MDHGRFAHGFGDELRKSQDAQSVAATACVQSFNFKLALPPTTTAALHEIRKPRFSDAVPPKGLRHKSPRVELRFASRIKCKEQATGGNSRALGGFGELCRSTENRKPGLRE